MGWPSPSEEADLNDIGVVETCLMTGARGFLGALVASEFAKPAYRVVCLAGEEELVRCSAANRPSGPRPDQEPLLRGLRPGQNPGLS